MCGEESGYGGAHVAGGDDGEGCVGCHCGSILEGLDLEEMLWSIFCMVICPARYGRYGEKRKEITS